MDMAAIEIIQYDNPPISPNSPRMFSPQIYTGRQAVNPNQQYTVIQS